MKHLSSTVGFIRILILVGITHVSLPVHSSHVDKNDSLLNIINTSPNDTDKVIHYIKLCDWNNYSDSKQAMVYAQSAIAIAKKAGYHKGIAKGYERLGNAYFQLGDNRQAAENYLNARDANKKVGNYQLDASVYYNLGNIQHELGNYDSAIYYANEAGKIFKANNDSIGYGASLYLASGEYNTKGNYDQATAYILEALAIFRKKGVREWEVYALNHLVEIYNVQKKYDKSLELLNTCLDYHRTFNNAKFMAITYRFMGDIYIVLENFEKARTVLDSSLYINTHYGFVQEKCKTMYSLGKLEFETGNYDKALKMYTEGLKLSFDLEDELFKCSNYLGIGQCLYEQKKYADAVDNLERSIIHAKQLEDIFKLRDGYLSLSQNYEALNEPDKALSNFKLFKQFSDSVTYQENKRQFAELASKFETEKKEQQISELQKEKVAAQANNRRMVFLWILTIIAGLLIVSILILAYRKNKQLLNKEKELDKVKSRFFSNISHEFRTPLTLILGPVRDMLQKKESKHIQPGLELVQKQAERLMQLINQIMDLSKLDANKYQLNISTGDFVAAIKSTVWSFHSIAEIQKIDLSVNTDRDEWHINFDRENIETVLNNLLSNAFKFEPDGGVIEVTLQSDIKVPKNHLQLSIRNRGSYISPDVCALIFDRFYQSKGGAVNRPGHRHRTGFNP